MCVEKKNNEIVPALHHGHSFQRTNQKEREQICVYCGEHARSYYSCRIAGVINTGTLFVNRLRKIIVLLNSSHTVSMIR